MKRFSEAAQRIGGPYSVTWFAFWVTLLLNFINHYIGGFDLNGLVLPRIGAVLLSQALMFAVLLLAKATVLRHTAVKPRPVLTMLCFVLAGLARALVLLVVLSQYLDLTPTQVAQRLLGGPIPFAAYLAVCAYLMDVYHQNKRTLARSAAIQTELDLARTHAEETLASRGSEAVDKVRGELARQLDAEGSTVMTPEKWDAFLDDTVRPMSHRLADRVERWTPPASEPVQPRISARRLFASIGIDRPFSPGAQALLGVAPIIASIAILPFWRFVICIVMALVSPWVMLTAGNWALRGLTSRTPLLTRTAAVVGWTLFTTAVVAFTWAVAMIGTPIFHSAVAYGIVEPIMLTAALVAGKTALTAQRTLEADLDVSSAQLRWEIARVNQIQWLQQQQLARALHGPVATAIIHQAATSAGDDLSLMRERVIDVLDASLTPEATPTSLTCLASEVQGAWGRICDVTFQIDPGASAAEGDSLALACLSDMLHEAINNAVRHGDARRVLVDLVPEGDALRVTVRNDGSTSPDLTGKGLGSRMLDECCLEWERDQVDSLMRLSFLLPVVWAEPLGSTTADT